MCGATQARACASASAAVEEVDREPATDQTFTSAIGDQMFVKQLIPLFQFGRFRRRVVIRSVDTRRLGGLRGGDGATSPGDDRQPIGECNAQTHGSGDLRRALPGSNWVVT